jgi:hypothetical protein
MRELSDALPEGALVVVDTGHSAARYCRHLYLDKRGLGLLRAAGLTMASGTRTNSAWQPSIVFPNFHPPIALKPCFSPGPSWLRQPHKRALLSLGVIAPAMTRCPSRKPVTEDPSFSMTPTGS